MAPVRSRRRSRRPLLASLAVSVSGQSAGWPPAASLPGMDWPPPPGWEVPLFQDLGNLHYPVNGGIPERSQQFFNQGLRFVAAFDAARATLSFRQAQRYAESRCAMCLWGEALALGPNLNAFDEPRLLGSVPLAFATAQAAHTLQLQLSPVDVTVLAVRDTRLTEALLQRFAETPAEFVAREPQLRHAYAAAMEKVADEFPLDTLVLVLAAESLMACHPWDYWLENGAKPRPETERAISLLEKVLGLEPANGWAAHLYVHITEASSDPLRAVPYARQLPNFLPGAPHIVHMAFHTLMHCGGYPFSERLNFEATHMARQVYPMHNLDTLSWLCRMQGNFSCAQSASMHLEEIASRWSQTPHVFENAFPASRFAVQHLLTLVAFGDDFTLLEQAPPPDFADQYWIAIWHFATGVAAARRGRFGQAKQSLESLQRARTQIARMGKVNDDMPPWAFGNFGGDQNWGAMPVAGVLDVAGAELRAHIFQGEGRLREAVAQWRHAQLAELALPYDEPPAWYLPVAGRLGAALLKFGDFVAAEQVYNATLQRFPNDGWNLFGLLQYCEQAKESKRAKSVCHDVKARFRHAWRFADVTLRSSGEANALLEQLGTPPGGMPGLRWLSSEPSAVAGLFLGVLLAVVLCGRPSRRLEAQANPVHDANLMRFFSFV